MCKLLRRWCLVASLLFSAGTAGANPILSLYRDVRDNTQFHFLDNFQPSTFFDFERGHAHGGVLTEVVSYRFLGGLGGIQKNLSTNQPYEPVVSFGLKLDYFSNRYIRKISDSAPLMSRLALGPYVGYTFTDKIWIYGGVITLKFDITKSKEHKDHKKQGD